MLEDFIFHECTTRRPTRMLMTRYLSATHIIFAFVLCPSMFGFPNTRRRNICVAIGKRFIMATQSVPKDPVAMFGSSCFCTADVFFCASERYVQAFLQWRLAAQHKQGPASSNCVAALISDIVMSRSMQRRLGQYEAWIAKKRLDPMTQFSDLTQNCSYSKGTSTILGCLLTKSQWYAHVCGRFLLPLEMIQVMGVPAFPSIAKESGWTCPWSELLAGMFDVDVQRLAGNGLHVCTVAAALLWAWSCIKI